MTHPMRFTHHKVEALEPRTGGDGRVSVGSRFGGAMGAAVSRNGTRAACWAACLALLALAPAASAAPLPFDATLRVQVAAFPEISVSASGVLEAQVAPGVGVTAFTVPAGVFSTVQTTAISPQIPIGPFLLTAIGVDARNAAGAFTGSVGTLGLSGAATLFVDEVGFPIPLTGIFGITGSASTSLFGATLLLSGEGFRTGVASALSLPVGATETQPFLETRMGSRQVVLLTPLGSATLSEAPTTPGASFLRQNRLSYVAPTQVEIPGLIGPLAAFGTLEITIEEELRVPEPGVLLLVAGLCLALVLRRDP